MVEYAELRGFLGGMLWNGRAPMERSRVEVTNLPSLALRLRCGGVEGRGDVLVCVASLRGRVVYRVGV